MENQSNEIKVKLFKKSFFKDKPMAWLTRDMVRPMRTDQLLSVISLSVNNISPEELSEKKRTLDRRRQDSIYLGKCKRKADKLGIPFDEYMWREYRKEEERLKKELSLDDIIPEK